jgi:predicted permease
MKSQLRSYLNSLLHRGSVESNIEAELRTHIELRAEDLQRTGLTPAEALRRARIEFGPIETHKENIRSSLGLRLLGLLLIDELRADLRYAIRMLRRSPGFTAIAVASLALAIGANTTIFSYANQVLFVRLGVPHPEQLRVFRLTGDDHIAVRGIAGNDAYVSDDGHFHLGLFPYPAYRELRQQNHFVEDIVAFMQLEDVDITAAGTPEVGKAELVSGNFYSQMQVKPQIGRPIEAADDGAPAAGAVTVISDGFWHREFGGAQDVIGKTIRVNMTPVTIIGVNPPSFRGTVAADTSAPEVFLPMSMLFALIPESGGKHPLLDPNDFVVQLMARVKPGISPSAAGAALDSSFNAAFRGTAIVNKGETVPKLSLEDGSRGITSGIRNLLQPLYVLLGLAGLVLLLACANIANLMLARASLRQREMSVRMALGAGQGRILRQVLTESLLISAMGGLAGLLLGYVSRNLIPWLMHTGWDGGEMPIGFDWRVFGFTSAATLLTGIVFGVAPAWRSTRADINTALKDGARTSTRRRKPWSGKAIVGFQVGLSTLLVVSAIFFLRTLFNLNSVDPGFRTQNLLLVDVTPPRTESLLSQSSTLHSRVKDALATVPGVQEVTYVNHPLGAHSYWRSQFLVEGIQRDPASDLKKTGNVGEQAMVSYVGPRFFSTMSIPILAGRGFTAEDTESSIPVSVVNQALVRKFFPNTNPIGKRFRRGLNDKKTRWIEIIGICADTRYNDMREPTPPVHFDLDRQSAAPGGMTYIISSAVQPAVLVPSLRRALQEIDPDLPLNHIRTQQQQIDASMQQERMFASLTAGFGLLALALACVGIYGIMAYTVSQRTNEIGIRMALGARTRQVLWMILRESSWLALLGIAAGIAAALGLTRFVRTMLYGLQPTDPATFIPAALLLLAIAIAAGYGPARRASRIDPMQALRHE